MLPKVIVLLSSFNGEKYITQQVDSILSQSDVDIQLLIRDDGSNDRTLEILKGYKDGRIRISTGKNMGSTASFFRLIEEAGEADYYAFSDQDDVWDDDKLFIAISSLEKYKAVPAIYSSNTRLVDQNLHFISNETLNPRTTLGSAIVKNYVTGCTTVFNNELMQYLKKSTNITVPYHDWWANLVALSVGGVSIYDVTPHMSYRQHANNVVGATDSFIKKWQKRFVKFKNTQYHRDLIANKLLRIYSDKMSNSAIRTMKKISDYQQNKCSIIFDKNIRTNKKTDNLAFLICLLTNRI